MRVNTCVRIGGAVVAVGLLGATAGSPALAADAPGRGTAAWWYTAMEIADAHKIATGKGVTIAVIDSAIDPKVPELKGQDVTAAKNFCSSKLTTTGADASHGTQTVVTLVGNGRGTLPGGVGVAGIAPGAKILAYAVDSSAADGLQCDPRGNAQAIADAIDEAVAAGARIINISLGGNEDQEVVEAAVKNALATDVLVVAAAGNGPKVKTVAYPAAYPGVVAAVAVDRNAKPWSDNVKGNRDAFVIAGPGVEVPTGAFDGSTWRSDANVTGTSLAAPLVAGSLALVAEKYPRATANQLIQHLIRNPGGNQTFGRDKEVGYGIVSPSKMLASDPAQWPDVNPLIFGASAAPSAPGASVDGSPVAAAGDDDGGGSSAGPIAGGVAAVVVIGAAVAFFMTRRRTAGAG